MCVQALPTRPAMPQGAAAEFRNGLPLCTDCGAPPPTSPSSLRGTNAAGVPISQAGPKNMPHAVLRYVPVACVLALLALAFGALCYWHRRRPPGDAGGKELRTSSHNSHGSTDKATSAAAAAGAGLGPTAVRPPLPAERLHSALYSRPNFTLQSGSAAKVQNMENPNHQPTWNPCLTCLQLVRQRL